MLELTGLVIRPGDAGWDGARVGFARWADYAHNIPRAVVFCQDAGDVVNAVRWARVRGVPVRARCGRHSYEGISSLVKDGLIIDVSALDSVSVSADRKSASVGSGIDVLDLSEGLGDVGVTLPLATGPSVGIAGLTLGGGFGMTSRKWGLTCDNLEALEIVTADGDIRTASRTRHPDLFWACRGGGGGNFGIVTAFRFNVHAVSNVALFTIEYDWRNFEPVVAAWQSWSHTVDENISCFLTLLSTRKLVLQGQYTGDEPTERNIRSLLAPMITGIEPASVVIRVLPNQVASRVVFGVDPSTPEWRVHRHSDSQIFKSSSAFAYEPFSAQVIAAIKHNLENVPHLSAPPSQPSMIQLLAGGGAVARPATDATAAFHRKAKFVVQYDAYWADSANGHRTVEWIDHFRNLLVPYTRGAYVNYVDHSLDNPLDAYYGDNLAELMRIKRKYDSTNFFRFPQSIPVATR